MYVERFGSEEGPPLIFLHGAMVAGWMWREQADALTDHCCFLPDLPGWGRSAEHGWRSLADTAEQIAALIAGECDGGRAHVVGLSLGGLVGLHLAAQTPERVRSLMVSGVPMGRVRGPLQWLNRAFAGLYARPWGAGVVATAFGLPDDESRAAFLATAAQTPRATLAAVQSEIAGGALPRDPGAITPRSLLVVGERDLSLSRDAVPWLVDRMPNALGFEVPGVGHQWNAEDGQGFTALVRAWIDGTALPDTLRPLGAAVP